MDKNIYKELEGTTVLVVDDDIDVAEVLKDQLEEIGMKVVGMAHSGPDAIKLVMEQDPALVILDIVMPGMDGIEVARKINETEPRPIMFLSAYSDIKLIDKARRTGVFTYLVKPVSIDKMVPSIVLTLDHFREMVTLKATVDDMRETVSNQDLIEKARNMLMDTRSMSADEAATVIKKRGQEDSKPMVDVARTILQEEEDG